MGRLVPSSRAWLMALAFAALILSVSSIPAQSMPRSQSLWRFDKLIHALEYGVLAALVFRALHLSRVSNLLVVALMSALACSGFGILDELYQSTVPGRDSSIFDVAADLAGACFASLMSAVFYSRPRSSRGHHSKL